jgi:hypothetical protein
VATIASACSVKALGDALATSALAENGANTIAKAAAMKAARMLAPP